MITIPTEDEIFNRLVAKYLSIAGPMNVEEGSIPHDFLKPTSMELAEAYRFVLALYYALWVEYAEGENLDLAVSTQGIERKKATKATLPSPQLKLQGASTDIIRAGTRFMTEGTNPLFFVLPEDVRLDGLGNGFGLLIAEDAGQQGNLKAGTILLPVQTVNGLQSVELLSDLEGGADEESDTELRSRYWQKVRRRATSGNAAHYMEWALEVPGVTAARVFENLDGPNTVRVVLLGQNGLPPDASIVEAAKKHILSQRPLGPGNDGIFVVAAVAKPFNFSASVKLDKGFTVEEIASSYSLAINDYFSDLQESTDSADMTRTIIWTKSGALLHGIKGVLDYNGLTINGAAANATFGPDEVPVLGMVTLEVMA
ncbi:baseplate J/gp47 family protein [Brevibacillus sp. FSL L8-0520]|uniref:baseplate J/gp47 family protein n=1 Tax=Brevibacillus sp. FSL L8-0520 TaxID=2954689 RepID=UPI0030D1E01A